jgi:hypothetical protein
MKSNKRILLSILALFFLSTFKSFSIEPEKSSPNKEVEKVEINVNNKTHIVYVNKTMIKKIQNASDSSSLSSVVVYPVGKSHDLSGEQWDSYMLNVKTGTN